MSLIRDNVLTFDDVRRALTFLNPSNWQPFTCSWTTASSAPAVGNGTLVAYYQVEGPMCRVSIKLTCGSSTTFGTGAWYFSMPKTCVAGVSVAGTVVILDSGTQYYSGACMVEASTNVVFPVTYEGAVTSGSPQAAWATGDTLTMTIEYPWRNG